MRKKAKLLYRAFAYVGVAAVSIALMPVARADVIFITISGTTLKQNVTPKTNELTFNQGDFPNYMGYDFAGVLKEFPGIIRLQDFTVTRPQGQNLMPLGIVFGAVMDKPKATEIIGQDAIAGNFNNKLGKHILGKGNMLSFQGFVDFMAIMPPKGAYTSAPAGGTRFPVPFGGAHGPFDVKGNPPWILTADLSITLGVEGDRIAQAPIPPGPPFDASVSIVAAPAKMPEPTSWATLLMGLVGMLTARNLAGRQRITARRL
jgi:hypothetical protein